MRRHLRAAAVLLAAAWCLPAAAGPTLLMIEEKWCDWCKRWDAEIGVVYDKTAEGRRAPLRRHDIHEPLPEDVTLDRRAHFTPTFVLLDGSGREVGRIEGYPGEDFFYGLLGRLLDRHETTRTTKGEETE